MKSMIVYGQPDHPVQFVLFPDDPFQIPVSLPPLNEPDPVNILGLDYPFDENGEVRFSDPIFYEVEIIIRRRGDVYVITWN